MVDVVKILQIGNVSKSHWLKKCNKNQSWLHEIPNQKNGSRCEMGINAKIFVLLYIKTFNKAISLRMSSRSHNEYSMYSMS